MSDLRSPRNPVTPFALLGAVFLVFTGLLAFIPGQLFSQEAPKAQGNTTNTQGLDPNQGFSSLQRVYQFILNNYVDEVEAQKLIEGAFKGMFESLEDPYSVYLTQSDMRDLNDTTSGEFGGIGAYIDKERDKDGKVKVDGYIEIAAPIEDTPAFLANLQSGDFIVTIDATPTRDLTVDEAVKRLRGKPGSKLVLEILRGKGNPFTVTLTREIIQVPTEKSAMIGDVAYIRLIQFTPHTVERFTAAWNKFAPLNPRGLIIDLRNNPGGVLDSPLDIADMFFDDGIILSTKGRMNGESQIFEAARGTSIPANLPVIVLVNGGSASASEILSGALKDRGRGIVVGETTFGKGLVQRVIPLPPGNHGFKLTTSRYYTPSGVSINKIGIKPDVEVLDPVLSAEEQNDLIALREKELVQKFLDATPAPGSADKARFQAELVKAGIELQQRMVDRLIKVEMERRNKVQSIYDTEFDLQLIKALELVNVWETIKKQPSKGQGPQDLPSPSVPGKK